MAETHPQKASPDASPPAPILRTVLPMPQNSDPAPELFDRLRLTISRRIAEGETDIPSADDAGPRGSTVPAALLDSSDHAHTPSPERSRRSILAFSAGPHALQVRHRGGMTWETGPQGTVQRAGPFFTWLAEAWPMLGSTTPTNDSTSAIPATEQPFVLGWVGWLGYGLKRESGSPDGVATLRQDDPAALPTDDARLFRATHAVVLDHQSGTAEVQSIGEDSAWVQEVKRAVSACADLSTAVPASSPPGVWAEAPAVTGLRARDTRQGYLQKIKQAQEQIRLGNSYEICLTTSLAGQLSPCDGFSLFRRLRECNRAPFTQYLCLPGADAETDVELLSTSPERFLSISPAGLARSEPIKGTRERGASPQEDDRLRHDLLSHPKDRAENVMITDLVRNDLSIHAVPGTLRTERLCDIETYPTVHQMVSTVSSQITPETPRASMVAAAFPPGSMTGAPKISTMDILEELESGPRGPYSGVAGYFSTTGGADLSVLIRTAVLTEDSTADHGDGSRHDEDATSRGPLLHLGLGGAITADSDPSAEWAEVRAKSAGVLSALGQTFPER